MVREDLENKTAKNTDHMKTCFIEPPEGNKYNLQLYLFPPGLIAVSDKLGNGWERYSDFEIIVISEPENWKDIHSFLNSYVDPRIIFLVNDKRLGIAGSLNRGMQISRGDYIAHINSADLMVQERMFKQKKYLDKNPGTTLCTSDFEGFGDMREYRRCVSDEMSRAWSVITCPFDRSTVMFRREFF